MWMNIGSVNELLFCINLKYVFFPAFMRTTKSIILGEWNFFLKCEMHCAMCIGEKSIFAIDVHKYNRNLLILMKKKTHRGKTLLLSQDPNINCIVSAHKQPNWERFQPNNNDSIECNRQCCNHTSSNEWRNMQKGNAAFYSAEMSPNLTDHYVRFDPPFFFGCRSSEKRKRLEFHFQLDCWFFCQRLCYFYYILISGSLYNVLEPVPFLYHGSPFKQRERLLLKWLSKVKWAQLNSVSFFFLFCLVVFNVFGGKDCGWNVHRSAVLKNNGHR